MMCFIHMKPSSTRELDKLSSHVKIHLSRSQSPEIRSFVNDVWTPVFLQRNLASSLPMMSIGCHSLGIFLTIATSTCLPVLFGSPLQQKEFMPLHCIPFFRRILITLILSTP